MHVPDSLARRDETGERDGLASHPHRGDSQLHLHGTGTFDTFSYFTPTIITEIEPSEDGTPNTGLPITGNDFDATAIANATANGVITPTRSSTRQPGRRRGRLRHPNTGLPGSVTIRPERPRQMCVPRPTRAFTSGGRPIDGRGDDDSGRASARGWS